MEPEHPEQPEAKRVRLADAPQQPQGVACVHGYNNPPLVVPSSTTGATVAPAQQAAKPAITRPTVSALSTTASSAASSVASNAARALGACAAGPAPVRAAVSPRPSIFIANARDAVHFRAVSSPTAEAITAEIASGGQQVKVDFLHQQFGDAEQIRGYSGLQITIWIHVRTYHAWVDVNFVAKRPGADRLDPIFEGTFPSGYCRSQEEFVTAAAAAAAAMPDLMTLGECVGTAPVPPTAFGIKAAATSAAAQASAAGPVLVSVRRFHLISAPPEIKALHGRMEALLLFTIDGAMFIDANDPQWELLLPVARAEDGGCLVLGLTTLFNFFAYPASCRLRVSQVLVLSPWQGLGLGKALLRLSYNLAKSRGCADLTVEDPTPNLQRVREKLEVEMLRSLPWVRQQARKCLEAVARGEITWPAWEDKDSGQPTKEHEQQTEAQTEVALASKRVQGGSEVKEQAPAVHPLLAANSFFAALGAVPPPHLTLPEDVQAAATAAAEARWRQRLVEAENAAAVAAAAAGPSPPSGGTAGGAAIPAAAAGALTPSPAFISAIARKLTMHRGQIRIVWEALLWCEPEPLGRTPAVRRALGQLIRARLEAQLFFSGVRAAVTKKLVDIPPATMEAEKDHEGDFFMYRPVGRTAPAAALDKHAVLAGRLNLSQVTAADKMTHLEGMLLERRAQLESLAAVVDSMES